MASRPTKVVTEPFNSPRSQQDRATERSGAAAHAVAQVGVGEVAAVGIDDALRNTLGLAGALAFTLAFTRAANLGSVFADVTAAGDEKRHSHQRKNSNETSLHFPISLSVGSPLAFPFELTRWGAVEGESRPNGAWVSSPKQDFYGCLEFLDKQPKRWSQRAHLPSSRWYTEGLFSIFPAKSTEALRTRRPFEAGAPSEALHPTGSAQDVTSLSASISCSTRPASAGSSTGGLAWSLFTSSSLPSW